MRGRREGGNDWIGKGNREKPGSRICGREERPRRRLSRTRADGSYRLLPVGTEIIKKMKHRMYFENV